MPLVQTTLALPGESLADLSPQLAGPQAANLLALWTSLWHPRLLAETRQLPGTAAVDTLVASGREPGQLLLVPAVAQSHLTDPWEPNDPWIPRLQQFGRRSEVISRIAEAVEIDLPTDPALTADFYALGFAYLQMELLTRSMRYDRMTSLDSLRTAVVEAADARLSGDEATTTDRLVAAYDQLMQNRNHYYPIDFHLIDLSLTAPSTLGEAFAQECRTADKLNVLVSSEVLDTLQNQHPESLQALREAIDEGRVGVCGGTTAGGSLAELLPEQLLAELRGAQDNAKEYLGEPLRVFASHNGPFAPLAPGMLHRLGYHAAVLSNFAGGPMPPGSSCRTTWTALDNQTIEGLAAQPIDAGSDSAMLGLSQVMQQSMNYDLAASLLVVGWPGHRTEWYDDLRQVTKRSPLLGRPITLEDYFEITSSHDYAGTMPADDYPAPAAAKVRPESLAAAPDATDFVAPLAQFAGAEGPTFESLAKLLGTSVASATSDEPGVGTLWLNASPVPRNLSGGELPAFGWLWLPRMVATLPRCEEGALHNEVMDVVFDPSTGGISATRLHAKRGNRMSQYLAVAPIGPQGIAAGLQLAVDGWQVVESGDERGTLASRYRVVDRDGKTLAKLEQRTTLSRESHTLDIEVDFEPTTDRARHCAIASRIAVPDKDSLLTRGLGGVDLETQRTRPRADWIGIMSARSPVAVLCDQVRSHRWHSDRMLDTTLIEAAGENTRARLSYEVDCRYPAEAFAAWQNPGFLASLPAAAPTQTTGWWLRIGAANVTATHLATEQTDVGQVLRVRLLETAGRPVSTLLAAWRPIVEAQLVNFRGEPDQQLAIESGDARIAMAPYEFLEVMLLVSQ
jgi:hypothetical protein